MFRVLPPVEYAEVNKGNWPFWWKNMSANGSDVAFAHGYEQSKQQWAPLGEFMGLLVSSLGAEAYLMTRAFGAVARGAGGGNLWKVGSYSELKGLGSGLDAHHVGQRALMKKIVPGYSASTAIDSNE